MTEANTRRSFLAIAAAAGLAVSTAPAMASGDDAELLRLEKEIFAAYEAAKVYDDEILRCMRLGRAKPGGSSAKLKQGGQP